MEIREMITRFLYPAEGMALVDRKNKIISRDWVALGKGDSPDRFEEITIEDAEKLEKEFEESLPQE